MTLVYGQMVDCRYFVAFLDKEVEFETSKSDQILKPNRIKILGIVAIAWSPVEHTQIKEEILLNDVPQTKGTVCGASMGLIYYGRSNWTVVSIKPSFS